MNVRQSQLNFTELLFSPLTKVHPVTLSAAIFFSYLLINPHKLDNTAYMPVQSPLQIFIPESSPGFSAFQDLKLDIEAVEGSHEVANFEQIALKAREVRLQFPADLNKKIDNKNLEKENTVPQIKLQPIIVSQPIKPNEEKATVVANVNLKPLATIPSVESSSTQNTRTASSINTEAPKNTYASVVVDQKQSVTSPTVYSSTPVRYSQASYKRDAVEVEVIEGHNYLTHGQKVNTARVLSPALSVEFNRNENSKTFIEDSFTKNSQMLVGAYSDQHAPSLSMGSVGLKTTVPLFTKHTVDGLQQILKPGASAHDTIIWGRVLHQGKPVVGARAYLISAKDSTANYFSSYLPDTALQTTGVEGDFVITNVQPGLHMLAVYHPKLKFPVEFVPVESGMVTPVTVERSQLKQVKARSYMPFKGNTVFTPYTEAIVNDAKKAIALSSNEWKSLKIYESSGLMEIKTQATFGVEATHFLWSRNRNELNVPVITTEWFDKVAMRAGLTAENRQGAILGFGFNGSFDVYITDENAQIIYLNKFGEVISSETESIHRYGFIIVNGGQNYHQVSVVHQKSGKIASRIVQPRGDSIALVF